MEDPTPTTALPARVRVNENVLYRQVRGESVILNVTSGSYYGLDEVGARMWQLLMEHGNSQTVYLLLLEEYDVDPSQLRQDFMDLIDRLVDHDLVHLE